MIHKVRDVEVSPAPAWLDGGAYGPVDTCGDRYIARLSPWAAPAKALGLLGSAPLDGDEALVFPLNPSMYQNDNLCRGGLGRRRA